jgi:hypothetical protein
MAREILEVWFSTSYKPNAEDNAALSEVEAIEAEYRKSSQGSPDAARS